MKTAYFTIILAYLCCGLLLTTLTASPFVGADLVKRHGKHGKHGKNSDNNHAGAEQQQPTEPEPNVSTLLNPRPTLAFDEEFDFITSIPGIEFSAAQFFNRNDMQKTEDFWRPKLVNETVNTDFPPTKYFFDACLATKVGDIFKDAVDRKILKDSQVSLVNKWGTFDKQYKSFQPWNWYKDGIMAVSCQIFSIKNVDIPADGTAKIDFTKLTLHAEASTDMIKHMRKNGWSAYQVAKPSGTREKLEKKIMANKKQNN